MTRISSLPGIGQCPGFALLRTAEDGSSAAADNGSAAGRIIELWHRAGEHATAFEEAAQTAMREASEKFPRADMDQARTWALQYANDPRNKGVVVADLCEREVRLSLPCAPEDPTGQPIELVGHVDQIRRVRGQLRVWDTKSGKPGGLELLYSATLQIAAYALASTATLGEPVLPGGVIRLRAWDTKRAQTEQANAFFEAPWTLDECRGLLDSSAFDIGLLRQGIIPLRPGTHCQWCPGGAPNLCGARIDRIAEMPRSLTT
ncbi:MAG TPA: PD-(D/E)XK nuclease family protein [Terriglobales bacterium]|nr:PD-(D/E)XK nuclease family protein [Terriglobales bacterium]